MGIYDILYIIYYNGYILIKLNTCAINEFKAYIKIYFFIFNG